MIPRSLPNLVPGRIDSRTPDVAKRVSFASSDRQVNFRIGAVLFRLVIAMMFNSVSYLLDFCDCLSLFRRQLQTDIVKANEDLANPDGLGIVRDFGVDVFVNEDRIDLKQMLFEKQFDGVKDGEDGVLAARIRAFLLKELEADAK